MASFAENSAPNEDSEDTTEITLEQGGEGNPGTATDSQATPTKKKKKKKKKKKEDEDLPDYMFDGEQEEKIDKKLYKQDPGSKALAAFNNLKEGMSPAVEQTKKVVEAVKKKIGQVTGAFMKYGPPYFESPELQADLLEATSCENISALDVHDLLLSGIDPNCHLEEDNGNSPLHYVCRYVSLRALKMLLKAGIDVNIQNDIQMSAISYALLFIPKDDKKHEKEKCIELLLKRGADPNIGDKGGHTALEIAASKGNMNIVSLLLSYGARVRRDYKFISLKDPNAVDSALDEPPDLRILLQSKLDEELADELALKREQKKAELERMEQEKKEAMIQQKKEAVLKKRLSREKAAQKKEEIKGRQAVERIKKQQRQLEQRARALKLRNMPRPGVWEKRNKGTWDFKLGVTEQDSEMVSVLEQANMIKAELDRPGKAEIVAERWRFMTGHNLLPVGGPPPESDDENDPSASDIDDDLLSLSAEELVLPPI
mmetsp:Transcript_24228/g.31456  ORF Transcript_24228/g.31456 Transcript_24228/m.31456 type:complete len:486 (-) Transcript_24228:116-1573(-)